MPTATTLTTRLRAGVALQYEYQQVWVREDRRPLTDATTPGGPGP
jgi:hypothetical protein